MKPQEGPQERFLSSAADIAIFGGAAGGGKTHALLLEPVRHIEKKGFGAVFFRRNTTQIVNEGGLWDSSIIYLDKGGIPREKPYLWRFPSGAKITFAHLEYDKTVWGYQGSQIALMCFDELTHFTEYQFWYMMSRNRSVSGVRPYVRATCNPDADSWVKPLVQWWINPETGISIPERSGVIRWFVRIGEELVWADNPNELSMHKMIDENGDERPIPPKSLTFIAALLTDNKTLMRENPEYMANLLSLPLVERERLLGGNWNIRPEAGLFFKRAWIDVVPAAPAGTQWVRAWDLAATEKTASNDPSWTTGTRIGRSPEGRFYVKDHVYDRLSPGGVERLIKNTATQDGISVKISVPQDPGQAGKGQVTGYARLLSGYNLHFSPESGDKETRFSGFSSQCEAGNVSVIEGDWNERWFRELEGFPDGAHDDDADSTSRAFNTLVNLSNYTLDNV